MFGVNILGTGSYAPEFSADNEAFSKIVDTNDEWIKTRTGIEARRIAGDIPVWKMGFIAAKEALAAAWADPLDIGLIINTSITPDFYTPSTACVIQREIGAKSAAAFDLNAACSGFVYALDTAKRFLQTDESLKYALVVSNEALSRVTDYTDRATCVLFGDGAGAVLIGRSEEKLYSSWLCADGNGAKCLYAKTRYPANPFTERFVSYGEGFDGKDEGLFQDGREVYKFAVRAIPLAAEKALSGTGLSIEDIDWFIPHQANLRIIEAAAKNMGVPLDKFIVNIQKRGNTSSATVPAALHEAVSDGRIKRGDKICLIGFGAGLTMAAAALEY